MRVARIIATALVAPMAAVKTHTSEMAGANPIRRVVSLLQTMSKKVEEDGVKEEELFEKFMCYCKTSDGDLATSIADAEDKIPNLESDIKASQDEKAQVDAALKSAKADYGDAKAAMAEATKMREKQAAEYADFKADAAANIAAVSKATAALDKGTGDEFLQTDAASDLRKLMSSNKQDIPDGDRDALNSFLSTSQDSENPAYGEVTGILKQMGDEMSASLADATAAEEASIKTYNEMMSAKTKEVNSLRKIIETKTEKSGELAVTVAQLSNDLQDTQEALADDKKFLAELKKSCGTKEAEMEERRKLRQQELVALADTVKILNDDDALELFKKTLPSPNSFVQVQVSEAAVRSRALGELQRQQEAEQGRGRHGSSVLAKFVALALRGKRIGFEKVIAMIDEMTAVLKSEQKEDEEKKVYCEKELDLADDNKKIHERSIKDSQTAIAAAEEGIATLVEEIAALTKGVQALDKSVADATEQRKKENAEFKVLMQQDGAAKKLLKLAQNRLNKFYSPKLYKKDGSFVEVPAPQPRAIADPGETAFVQLSADEQGAPPPPPETFGAYTKKSEESGGVIQMINLLITDLEKEMTEAEVEEKNSQEDYEELMKEAAEKRATDSKSISEKEATKADLEEDLESHKGAKKEAKQELTATVERIGALHTECDWLLKYFEVRQEQRTGEIDSLVKSKAVLSGADFSL